MRSDGLFVLKTAIFGHMRFPCSTEDIKWHILACVFGKLLTVVTVEKCFETGKATLVSGNRVRDMMHCQASTQR